MVSIDPLACLAPIGLTMFVLVLLLVSSRAVVGLCLVLLCTVLKMSQFLHVSTWEYVLVLACGNTSRPGRMPW